MKTKLKHVRFQSGVLPMMRSEFREADAGIVCMFLDEKRAAVEIETIVGGVQRDFLIPFSMVVECETSTVTREDMLNAIAPKRTISASLR